MSIRAKASFLTIVVAVAITAIAAVFPAFFPKLIAQRGPGASNTRKEMIPVPLSTPDVDPAKRHAREMKNRRYGSPHGEDLTTQLPGEVFGKVSESAPVDPIPIKESDLVVVGRIMKQQSYLSESKTSIYSEFSIQVEDILKDDFWGRTTPGAQVVAEREGGAILMPNGQIVRYFVAGIGSLPEPNLRYALFLKRFKDSKDYVIVAGYELNPNGVSPLEDHDDRALYRGVSEERIIAEIRRKIATNH